MRPLLEVKNISISFGGIKAVQDVSFQVEQGEILGLIGPNGSGKSTCINLISGVYPVDTGEIIFDGHAFLKKETVPQRAKMGLGRTFQSPRPFGNLTVYDNIFTIALQKYDFEQAAAKTEEVLEITGLAAFADDLSTKLPIEKRKWLDFARILSLDPKLIMMDEVMAGLNPSEMEESLDLVRRINKQGITIVFIEHVMKAVVSLCHRTLVLNEGRVLCDGNPEVVLKREDVIKAYIGGGENAANK